MQTPNHSIVLRSSRWRLARKVLVLAFGLPLLLLGIVMLPLPGPGFPVVVLALSLLATELSWARNWVNKVRVVPAKIRGHLAR